MAITTENKIPIDREKIYEGLDAAHTPRLFVPELYVERGSRKLELLAARALLDSQMFPQAQFDVIWLGKKASRFLRAEVQPTGTWGNSFGRSVEDTDDLFLVDIARIEQGSDSAFTYVGRIEAALENGAGVFSPADLSRSYES